MGSTEPNQGPFVYVVDDDRGVRTSLVTLLNACSTQARPFASAEDVLEGLDDLRPGVFLIDIRMPGRTGIELLADLRARDCYWPVIIMTAHGEISLAVQAIKSGAIDFLEKPFNDDALQEVIALAFKALPETIGKSDRARMARRLLTSLSPRQRQVFEGVVAGLTSKQIAKLHGLSHRTVESYRLDMMNKLRTTQLVDLVELKAFLRECDLAD